MSALHWDYDLAILAGSLRNRLAVEVERTHQAVRLAAFQEGTQNKLRMIPGA